MHQFLYPVRIADRVLLHAFHSTNLPNAERRGWPAASGDAARRATKPQCSSSLLPTDRLAEIMCGAEKEVK